MMATSISDRNEQITGKLQKIITDLQKLKCDLCHRQIAKIHNPESDQYVCIQCYQKATLRGVLTQ